TDKAASGGRTHEGSELLLLLKHSTEFDLLSLFGSGALRECLFTAIEIALLAQQLAERIVRAGIVGVESDGCAERRLGAREVAILLERGAEHEIRLGIIRSQRDGSVHFFSGLIEFAALPVDDAQRVVRFGEAGVEHEGTGELALRAFEIVFLLQSDSQ